MACTFNPHKSEYTSLDFEKKKDCRFLFSGRDFSRFLVGEGREDGGRGRGGGVEEKWDKENKNSLSLFLSFFSSLSLSSSSSTSFSSSSTSFSSPSTSFSFSSSSPMFLVLKMCVRLISCKLERPGSTWGTSEDQRWWWALAIRAPGIKPGRTPEAALLFEITFFFNRLNVARNYTISTRRWNSLFHYFEALFRMLSEGVSVEKW